MIQEIENLKWRYATKKFDVNKKVSEANVDLLKEAIQLSASSYGLQLYKVLIITDDTLKQQLRPHSWNQSQIEDASHLFVFCNYTTVSRAHIEEYTTVKAEKMGADAADFNAYVDFIETKLGEQTAEEIEAWTAKQTYIACSNLMNAAAELKIDSCPMEGFGAEQYNKLLGLTEKGLNAAVLVTVGYRSEEDVTQHQPKVRKPMADLFEEH